MHMMLRCPGYLLGLFALFVCGATAAGEEPSPLLLMANHPAVFGGKRISGVSPEVYPLGNGRLGCVVYGGVNREQVQFNENSLWTGNEVTLGNYQNFGVLGIQLGEGGGAEITSPSGQTGDNQTEALNAAGDADATTKWCVRHEKKPVVWQAAYTHPQAITGYALTAGNDQPSRDPQSWVLEGSTDAEHWQELDRRKMDAPAKRSERKEFLLTDKTVFRYYRLTFAPPQRDALLQIAEIELLCAQTPPPAVNDYLRQLDIANAVHTVRYRQGETNYQRETFVSAPDQVIVIRLTADRPGAYSGFLELNGVHGEKTEVAATQDHAPTAIGFRGCLSNGLRYYAAARLLCTGGTVEPSGGRLLFHAADSLTVILGAKTDYLNKREKQWHGDDPLPQVNATIAKAAATGYEQLRKRHGADYRKLFSRVELSLAEDGPTTAGVPIRQRLEQYKKGNADVQLEALLFQYGRYLLISSSRPGSLPANLQGIWNDNNNPPWNCDYHTNINLQMNYWPAEVCNLSECHWPLFEYLGSLQGVLTDHTANGFGDVVGWENVKPWVWTTRTACNIFGATTWAWNNGSSAWFARHYWEHYNFTGDTNFLRYSAYPRLKEACTLWAAILRPLPDGRLTTPKGLSPEHGPIEEGVTYDLEIVHDLFVNYLKAARVLAIDPEFQTRIAELSRRLVPLKIGKWGQLQEWMTDRDDPNDQHRHVSHLFALYPGDQIRPVKTPEFAKAAAVSLKARGDGGTGWSKAWKVCFWARLQEGEHAYKLLRSFLSLTDFTGFGMENSGGVYENLLCAHPPFQIDGNFGITAGIAEMLLQSSSEGEITILPALPAAWKSGTVKGLCARAGLEVDLYWRDGKLQKAVCRNKGGIRDQFTIRYQGNVQEIALAKGTEKSVNNDLK